MVENLGLAIKIKKHALAQLNNTVLSIENFMNSILKEQKGLKFYPTLAVILTKIATGTNKNDLDVKVDKDDVKRQTAYFYI